MSLRLCEQNAKLVTRHKIRFAKTLKLIKRIACSLQNERQVQMSFFAKPEPARVQLTLSSNLIVTNQ